MVSCEIRIASSAGYSLLSQPEICSGEQSSRSFPATTTRRGSLIASQHLLGRRARSQACSSAFWARYLLRPPLRFTSRHTVEAQRPSRAAIVRRDSPAASPREISSRSAGVSAHLRLCRSGGEKPPVASSIPWMEPGAFCRARARSLMDPGPPPRPQLLLACRRQSSWTTQSCHSCTSGPDNTQNLPCCTDRLNPPLPYLRGSDNI